MKNNSSNNNEKNLINGSDSILDKIMDSYQSDYLTNFNPPEILANLFAILNDRERAILKKRYGLTDGAEKTLEEIGREFKVTRERIRQIENSAIQKIKSNKEKDKILELPMQATLKILDDHGGILHEDSLVSKLLLYSSENLENKLIAKFIINQLLGDRIEFVPESKDYYKAWKLMDFSAELLNETIDFLTEYLEKNKDPLSTEKILELSKQEEFFKERQSKLKEMSLISFLELTKKIETNPLGEWGMADWGLINLKKINDKIYLVLKNEGKPMHFRKIAEKINELLPVKKKANPATIHNELILDNKYVLIGRGIYALKEWGYQPGQVSDVIEEIIKAEGRSLRREEIIEKVFEKRQVKESTILLALMNKDKFKKKDGLYSIVEKVEVKSE
jgi:DNA-directed RNA polymerase delta subunit